MNLKRGHDLPEHGEWATIKAHVGQGYGSIPKYGKWETIKLQIRKIDDRYFRSSIFSAKRNRFGMVKLRELAIRDEQKIVIRSRKDITSPLALLCDKYGSDKGSVDLAAHPHYWGSHTYTDYYSLLFAHTRSSVRNVFECGIGNSAMGELYSPGASLRVWRDYFPQANIVGADVLEDNLFTDDRIKTYYVDQTDPDSISRLWDAVDVESFDLMIDDGLHTYEAGICLFENSIQKLAADGVYVIEDVCSEDLFDFRSYFADKEYGVELVSLTGPNAKKVDNNLVVIRKRN